MTTGFFLTFWSVDRQTGSYGRRFVKLPVADNPTEASHEKYNSAYKGLGPSPEFGPVR